MTDNIKFTKIAFCTEPFADIVNFLKALLASWTLTKDGVKTACYSINLDEPLFQYIVNMYPLANEADGKYSTIDEYYNLIKRAYALSEDPFTIALNRNKVDIIEELKAAPEVKECLLVIVGAFSKKQILKLKQEEGFHVIGYKDSNREIKFRKEFGKESKNYPELFNGTFENCDLLDINTCEHIIDANDENFNEKRAAMKLTLDICF